MSQVLDLIYEEPDPAAGSESVWSRYISEPAHYEVALKNNDAPGDLLSEEEDRLLDEIFAKYGHMPRWQLRDFAHTLPEWRDP